MGKTSLRKLKDRAADALRKGDHPRAVQACQELAQRLPDDPDWPRRLADLYHRLGDREEELAALVRAADLYAAQGLVIQAIAACKTILSIDPNHSTTQERLGALCDIHEMTEETAPKSLDHDADAPLEEILLTSVVSGAQPAQLGDEEIEGIAEIPLDNTGGKVELDLRLPENLAELDPSGEEKTRPKKRKGAAVDAGSAQEQLRRTPLFGSLGPATLRRVIHKVRLLEIAEGEILFRQGSPADALYVVADGAVVPIAEAADGESQRTKLAVLEAGDFFGEVGLVTNQPRNATIQALVDTKLLVIDRSLMWELIGHEPGVFPVLLRFLRERLIDRLVRTSPLFSAFARAERSDVAQQFRFLEVRDGTTLINQGEVTEALFVLLAGSLDVIYMDTDCDKVLATLHPGDVCGERSLLLRDPALAAVVASGKCWVLALDDSQFRRILLLNPRLQQVIGSMMEQREMENSDSFRSARGLADGDTGLV